LHNNQQQTLMPLNNQHNPHMLNNQQQTLMPLNNLLLQLTTHQHKLENLVVTLKVFMTFSQQKLFRELKI
jgi:hypothetical protein